MEVPPSSENATVPVGVPDAETGATLAERVTAPPTAGLAGVTETVVVVSLSAKAANRAFASTDPSPVTWS